MQKTIYTCDHDGKEIGPNKHITLQFGQYSGIAVPPGERPKASRWAISASLTGKFVHFCGPKCIAAYFSKLMKEVK